MQKTVYGKWPTTTADLPWEPFTKIRSASFMTRYLHKGKHRDAEKSNNA